jgi:hypothetical protein
VLFRFALHHSSNGPGNHLIQHCRLWGILPTGYYSLRQHSRPEVAVLIEKNVKP